MIILKVTKNQGFTLFLEDASFEKLQVGTSRFKVNISTNIVIINITIIANVTVTIYYYYYHIISITRVIIIIIVSIIITFINTNSFTTFSKQVFLKKELENPIICFSMDHNGNKYQQFSKLCKASKINSHKALHKVFALGAVPI